MPARPLISFLVVAYNQESFVREAVAGALAQTYSPLEIILSDDCSPDRTFDIMAEMTAAYQGPHQIVLNRNPVNLGLARHVDKVCELARGDLLVAAAGDDVSLAERTATLFEAWLGFGGSAHSIFSNATIIDQDGTALGEWFPTPWQLDKSLKDAITANDVGLLGCSHMFSRRTFSTFGPLHPGSLQEDNAIGFRSLILGRIEYLPVSLVRYRRHGNNLWQARGDPKFRDPGRRRNWLRGEVATIEGKLADLTKGLELGLVDATLGEGYVATIQQCLDEKRLELEFSGLGVAARTRRAIQAARRRKHSWLRVLDLWVDSFQVRMLSKTWRSLRKRLPNRPC